MELDGIFTFRGLFFPGADSIDPAVVGRAEGEFIVGVADVLRRAGIPIGSVSAGSTPTGPYGAQVRGVTEVRPGTYVFQDRMQAQIGACRPDEIALAILATVVSRPLPDVATLDAGSKTFCGDLYPPALGLEGYGAAADGSPMVVESMSEEHGVVRLGAGVDPRVGDKIRFYPNHVCTAVNLSDELLGVRGGVVERAWAVQARGKRE